MLAIMLIMIVLLVYRIIMIKQIEQTQVAKDVVRLHIVAASTILFYAMTILDINDTVALASYGLYFWCSDFLLIFFFIYINDFTQETFVNKRGGLILGILIAIDGILRGCLFMGLAQFYFRLYYPEIKQRDIITKSPQERGFIHITSCSCICLRL